MLSYLTKILFIDIFGLTWFSRGFQAAATPSLEAIVDFHNYVFFFLFLVLLFVLCIFFDIYYNYLYKVNVVYQESLGLEGGDFYNAYFFILCYLVLLTRYTYHKEIDVYRVGYPDYGKFFRKRLFIKLYKFFLLGELVLTLQFFSQIRVTRRVIHGSMLEFVWTMIPAVILICIAIPSLLLLYKFDHVINPSLTIKAIGYQWFWAYEYSDVSGSKVVFDSIMVGESDLNFGYHRLLEVDNRVIIPQGCDIRVLVTAADVLHSWAIPSLGIKIDAVPGRLNQVFFFAKRSGVFYGQCSELCGINHGFMPIVIKII